MKMSWLITVFLNIYMLLFSPPKEKNTVFVSFIFHSKRKPVTLWPVTRGPDLLRLSYYINSIKQEEETQQCVKWSSSRRLGTNNSDLRSVVSRRKYTDKRRMLLPVELGFREREEGTSDLTQSAEASPVINEFVIPPWLAINDLTRRAAVIN